MMEAEFGLCTGMYFYPEQSWENALRRIADLGSVRYVQFYPDPPRDDPEAFRKLLDKLGLVPESWHYGHSFDVADERELDERVKWCKEGIDICARMGIQILLLHARSPGHLGKAFGPYELLVEAVKRCAEHAKNRGIRLMFENVHPDFGAGEIARLARDTDPEVVGVCLDTGHANVFGVDACAEVLRAGEHLFGLHVHDNIGLVNGDFFQSDRHLAPGEGNIDWTTFVRNLEKVGYRGLLMLELTHVVESRKGQMTRETVGKLDICTFLSIEERKELIECGMKYIINCIHQ